MRIGILASGEGTILQAIVNADLNVVVVISNKKMVGALRRAEEANIPNYHATSDEQILYYLQRHEVDIVFLAGYLKLVGEQVIKPFEGRIFNTHPAILPQFGGEGMYGIHVHQAVIAAGEEFTGITIHEVNEEYDKGAICAQLKLIPVVGDTAENLQKRVQGFEKQFIIDWLKEYQAYYY